MILIAYVPVLVALIGLLMYLIPGSPNPATGRQEVGRIMFWTGLLVTLFVLAKHTVHIG